MIPGRSWRARMEADPRGAGGSGSLKSKRAAWTEAGESVGSLRGVIKKALGELERGQEGLGGEASSARRRAVRRRYTCTPPGSAT